MSPRKKKARRAAGTAAGRQSKPQEAISTMTTVPDTTRRAPSDAMRIAGRKYPVESTVHYSAAPEVIETTETQRSTRVGFIYVDFFEQRLRAVAYGHHVRDVEQVAQDIRGGSLEPQWQTCEFSKLIDGVQTSVGNHLMRYVDLVEDGGICAEPACDDYGTFEAFDRDEDRSHHTSFGRHCILYKLGSEPWALSVESETFVSSAGMAAFADEVQHAVARANVLNQGLRWRCDTCWGSPDEGHCLECGAVARAA